MLYSDRVENHAFSLYATPCPMVYEIYNFGRLFLGHFYNIVLLIYAWLWRRRFLMKECIFYPPLGRGVLKYLVSLPCRYYITYLFMIAPVVFWDKDFNARRRTPTHSNRPPEWLRWPLHTEWSAAYFFSHKIPSKTFVS